MKKRLWSVFTEDMNSCYFTGDSHVERHHIFGGTYKGASEKKGFMIPLRPDMHPNGVFFDKRFGDIDLKLKQMAQTYYELHYGTRQEFIAEFGKSRL